MVGPKFAGVVSIKATEYQILAAAVPHNLAIIVSETDRQSEREREGQRELFTENRKQLIPR